MNRYNIILLSLIIASCSGTKKVSEVKKEIKKDTVSEIVSVVKIDSTSKTNKIEIDKDEYITYEPSDKKFPMYIEGVPYENVIIKKVKKNTFSEIKNDVKLIKDKVDVVIKKGSKSVVESDKKLYKKYSTFNYMWILLIILVLYIMYRVYGFSRINF
jgi:hypothetical protein